MSNCERMESSTLGEAKRDVAKLEFSNEEDFFVHVESIVNKYNLSEEEGTNLTEYAWELFLKSQEDGFRFFAAKAEFENILANNCWENFETFLATFSRLVTTYSLTDQHAQDFTAFAFSKVPPQLLATE